jgi:hypothetical protein
MMTQSDLLKSILRLNPPTRPASLLLAEMLHGIAAKLEIMTPEQSATVLAEEGILEAFQRDALIHIARHALPSEIQRLAYALGVPVTHAELTARLAAVRDSRRPSAPTSEAKPDPDPVPPVQAGTG